MELYANTLSTYIDKLVKLNKVLRILLNQSRFCSISEQNASFNTLSIHELYKRQLLILVHNMLYHSNLLPDIYANYFTLNSWVHTHLTGSHSDIHIYRAYTSCAQRSAAYKGGILWNSLSADLKVVHSSIQFKTRLLHHFQTLRH
jgi:hypothetical protein